MTKQHPAKISLAINGYTITVEFESSDLTLDELFQSFRCLLIGATFQEEQIDDYIIEAGDILSYEKRNNG